MTDPQTTLPHIIRIAVTAGAEILDVYESPDFEVESKADDSPLTRADRRSHEAIVGALRETFPEVPVLSEEGRDIPYQERSGWDRFWLVDPLDGTKEFIKRNGEFTVNIALIEQGRPVLGVVLVPVTGAVYYAAEGLGSYRANVPIEPQPLPEAIEARMASAERLPLTRGEAAGEQDSGDGKPVRVVASRSHFSDETREYVESLERRYGETEIVAAGSSLKLCVVAEGNADVYPRFGPTMEWDTAAGQAIAEQSGCSVLRTDNGERLVYNKESLLNPWFLVGREPFVTAG